MGINRGRDYTVVAGKIVDKSILGESGESADHLPGAFFMLPHGASDWASDTAIGGTVVAGNGSIVLFRMYVPYALRVRSISLEVILAQASAICSAGIYDRNGNRLGWSGSIDASTTGIKTEIDEEFSIPAAGFYWIAYTTSNLLATIRIPGSPRFDLIDPIRNAGRAQKVEHTLAATGGLLPATINLSSYSAIVRNPPFIKFQS